MARAIIAAILSLILTSASASTIQSFHVSGRLATSEPWACVPGVTSIDLTFSGIIPWKACHAWKQHVDAAGNRIRTDVFEPDALRELEMTIDVEVWCLYGGNTYGDIAPVARVRTQTGGHGRFNVKVPRTPCGIPTQAADSVVVRVTALMQYDISDSAGYAGTMRALADRTKWATIYSSVLPPEPSQYTDAYGDWIIPRFILTQQTLPLPVTGPLDIGDQVFFQGAAPDYLDYLRGAFGTWQNVATLHRKLIALLEADGHGAMYRRMFVTNPTQACTNCYTVAFANSDGGGRGDAGGFEIDQPMPSPPDWLVGDLVGIGLPAHEFGHSMHITLAPGSFTAYDTTMNATMNPSGVIEGYHTGYVNGTTLQQQEMGVAFIEGFGNAMGAIFINGCSATDHAWGDPDPMNAMWNPSNFTACDGDPLCPYGAFRLQMVKRGFTEGDANWSARLASLDSMAHQMAGAGAVMVGSTNELKFRSFFCDLLDSETGVGFAAHQIAGKTYLPDYLWHAAERLDGREPPLVFATYSSDPSPEQVQISIGTLLTAMDGFITGLFADPPIYPQPLWRSPGITDGANSAYNNVRLSVNGIFSPQALGLYLVNMGAVTRPDVNNILRANRMEELP